VLQVGRAAREAVGGQSETWRSCQGGEGSWRCVEGGFSAVLDSTLVSCSQPAIIYDESLYYRVWFNTRPKTASCNYYQSSDFRRLPM
jgi:hypothetical protein